MVAIFFACISNFIVEKITLQFTFSTKRRLMRSPRICWFLHKILWFLTSSDFVFINYSSNIVLVSTAEAKPSLTFLIPMECTHGFWSWRRKLLALMRHSKKRSAFISFFFWTATIQYGNTKLIFFCVFSEADCLHFFPSIIKEESHVSKKDLESGEDIFCVFHYWE